MPLGMDQASCVLLWPRSHISATAELLFSFLGDRLHESSAVAEMGDPGQNRHGPKKGAAVSLSRKAGTSLLECGVRRGLLPY